MRMLLLLYGMCFCGVFIGQNKAMSQTNDPDGIVLRLEPYGRAESQEIQVAAKATLLVSPEGESGLEVAPAIFVLAEELVAAKNDEGTKAGYFRWSPESVQTVKVLLVNNAPRPIAYRIKVTEQIVRNSDSGKAAGHTIFRLYYATDREPAVDPRYAPYFGGKPAESGALSFGICEVSIPRDHRMGRLEIPSMWRLEFSPDPDKHVSVLKVTRRPESAFLGEIRGRVATAPGKQILVFIHGYNTTFDGAAKRTAQISYDLGFDGATVLYSWPSQGELTPIAYNQDQRNSELTTARFESLLEKLVSETGPQQIQVIAHSMGTRVISKALADFAAAHNAKPLPIKNVALMAPDIDAEVFRQISGQIIKSQAKVTLYASDKDEALRASEIFAGYSRAGQAGAKVLVVKGIDTIDASTVDTNLLGAMHQYYADSRTILSDLFSLLRDVPPGSRHGLRPVDLPGLHWMFAP